MTSNGIEAALGRRPRRDVDRDFCGPGGSGAWVLVDAMGASSLATRRTTVQTAADDPLVERLGLPGL